MSDHDARALLIEALDFFNDHPRFSLRRDRRRTSYELAARIDAFLAPDTAVLPIVAAARERWPNAHVLRSEEHTSELQSLMRISYAVFCWKKKKQPSNNNTR